ncbi:hypothetical protein SEPCBS57363_001622 [Sporothrix epigloea]|uniref:Membrane-associated protein n=1 Tax=Sporothrix epigloea TaxID=1892477 RepID=A0ABP0DCY3_9PEZI
MSICAAATAVSAVALASLGRSIHSQPNARMNSNAVPYLAGVAVTLCFAFAAQLLFLIIHFADGAIPTNNNQLLLETGSDAGGTNDIANRCNSSSSNNNRAGTNTHSPCSSVRVNPSKDGFDSWDTSDVDPQNRQTVLENSVLPHTKSRFLEAIPVSPLANWSPELKRAQSSRNWTRTYNLQDLSTHSANGTRLRSQSQSHSLPFGEENIHPLFRSSSSTPPPAISAGTVVTAALSASTLMTISDAQSLRALGRLRSGSLPAATSQLNWQGSVDCAVRRGLDTGEWSHTRCGSAKLRENAVEVTTNGDYTEEDEADRRSRTDSNTERKMTPPIPEWILGAGSRTSLSDYMSRKVCV